MAVVYAKIGTLTLTGSSITVQGREGWRSMGVKCASTSAGSIYLTGDTSMTIGGVTVNAIALAAGEEIAVGGNLNIEINGLTINAASGTAQIIAYSTPAGLDC